MSTITVQLTVFSDYHVSGDFILCRSRYAVDILKIEKTIRALLTRYNPLFRKYNLERSDKQEKITCLSQAILSAK